MSWPWNPGQRSLKVIGTDTYWSATYDFLLTFHSNHGPISYRFRDKRRLQSKIVKKNPTPCMLRPVLKGFPLGIGYRRSGSKKLEWWGYQAGKKVWRYLHPSRYHWDFALTQSWDSWEALSCLAGSVHLSTFILVTWSLGLSLEGLMSWSWSWNCVLGDHSKTN